jgi:hypothetical protein
MANITKEAWDYISSHLSIRDCLDYGVVNYSALARKISKELGIDNEKALMAACRRYRCEKGPNEDEVLSILERSEIGIKTGMAIIIARSSWHQFSDLGKAMGSMDLERSLKVIKGTSATTIIVEEPFLEPLERIIRRDIVKVSRSLAQITITSPEEIEDVPGVVHHILSSLSSAGINVVEVMSCFTDTILILDQKDVSRSFDMLSRWIGRLP